MTPSVVGRMQPAPPGDAAASEAQLDSSADRREPITGSVEVRAEARFGVHADVAGDTVGNADEHLSKHAGPARLDAATKAEPDEPPNGFHGSPEGDRPGGAESPYREDEVGAETQPQVPTPPSGPQ